MKTGIPRAAVPNVLTVSRLPLSVTVYFLVVNRWFLPALGILVIAQVTDWVDGSLARMWHAQTRFGEVIEHVVDSSMLMLPGLGLTQIGVLPAWLFVGGCAYCGLTWVAPQRIRRVWLLNAVLGMRSLLYGLAVIIIPFLVLKMLAEQHPALGLGIFFALTVYCLGTIYWKRGRIQFYVRRFRRRMQSSAIR